MYQKCPVCDGTGLVSRPPGVAGDQETWVSNDTGPYTCRACGGSGLILSPYQQCCCVNGWPQSTAGCPVHGVVY